MIIFFPIYIGRILYIQVTAFIPMSVIHNYILTDISLYKKQTVLCPFRCGVREIFYRGFTIKGIELERLRVTLAEGPETGENNYNNKETGPVHILALFHFLFLNRAGTLSHIHGIKAKQVRQ